MQKSFILGYVQKQVIFIMKMGERIPDYLTYQALIQRLGKSTCDFTYYLSHDEYQYFIWMEKVRHAIKEKQWDELEKLLAMVYKPVSLCNEKLRTQYYMYLQAILMIERNQDYEEASKLVKQAISVTKPNRRFTEMEINLFLLESVLAKKLVIQTKKSRYVVLKN